MFKCIIILYFFIFLFNAFSGSEQDYENLLSMSLCSDCDLSDMNLLKLNFKHSM